jgi:hypothetical protein
MARRTERGKEAEKGGAIKGGAMTPGQRAYEARRAQKAGMTLDRWLDQKRRAEAADAAQAAARARAAKPTPPKKPGFFARLIERAHKPLS